ncbi:hypothetical protein E2320_016534, partial [Naja naja]
PVLLYSLLPEFQIAISIGLLEDLALYPGTRAGMGFEPVSFELDLYSLVTFYLFDFQPQLGRNVLNRIAGPPREPEESVNVCSSYKQDYLLWKRKLRKQNLCPMRVFREETLNCENIWKQKPQDYTQQITDISTRWLSK